MISSFLFKKRSQTLTNTVYICWLAGHKACLLSQLFRQNFGGQHSPAPSLFRCGQERRGPRSGQIHHDHSRLEKAWMQASVRAASLRFDLIAFIRTHDENIVHRAIERFPLHKTALESLCQFVRRLFPVTCHNNAGATLADRSSQWLA